MQFIIIMCSGLLPCSIWLMFFYFSDQYHPHGLAQIVLCWGGTTVSSDDFPMSFWTFPSVVSHGFFRDLILPSSTIIAHTLKCFLQLFSLKYVTRIFYHSIDSSMTLLQINTVACALSFNDGVLFYLLCPGSSIGCQSPAILTFLLNTSYLNIHRCDSFKVHICWIY